jgi:hypothetical protein
MEVPFLGTQRKIQFDYYDEYFLKKINQPPQKTLKSFKKTHQRNQPFSQAEGKKTNKLE